MNKVPEGSKTTLRTQLNQVWKTTGVQPKDLANAPKLPDELVYLWDAYVEVYTGIRLTYTEVKSWLQVTKRFLSPNEIHAIMELDNLNYKITNNV